MEKLGTLSKDSTGYQVRLERTYAFSAETVWDAITNPAKMSIWFTDVEMDFVPGGKMIIRFRDKDRTETFGRVVRIIPGQVFEFLWLNDDGGPDELGTWELFPEGDNQCRLVLTYSRVEEKFATSVPAGWHVILDHLQEVLNGRTEPYPFGNGETPEDRIMVAHYKELFKKTFVE